MQVITKVKFNSYYNYYLNTTLRRPRRQLVLFLFLSTYTEYDQIMATPTRRPMRPIYSMTQWLFKVRSSRKLISFHLTELKHNVYIEFLYNEQCILSCFFLHQHQAKFFYQT